MAWPDPALALSPVETEMLRDLRGRLNRVPKGQLGDKSVAPLSKGFFDVCARVGLPLINPAPGLDMPAPGFLFEVAKAADMEILRRLVTDLNTLRQAEPFSFRHLFDNGLLQAIATRRLVLGGREQPVEG